MLKVKGWERKGKGNPEQHGRSRVYVFRAAGTTSTDRTDGVDGQGATMIHSSERRKEGEGGAGGGAFAWTSCCTEYVNVNVNMNRSECEGHD